MLILGDILGSIEPGHIFLYQVVVIPPTPSFLNVSSFAWLLSSGGGWRARRPGLLLGSGHSQGFPQEVLPACTWLMYRRHGHGATYVWSGAAKSGFSRKSRESSETLGGHPLAVRIGGLVGWQLVIRRIKCTKLNCTSMHIFNAYI